MQGEWIQLQTWVVSITHSGDIHDTTKRQELKIKIWEKLLDERFEASKVDEIAYTQDEKNSKECWDTECRERD